MISATQLLSLTSAAHHLEASPELDGNDSGFISFWFDISFALPQRDSDCPVSRLEISFASSQLDIDLAVSQFDIGFASSCGIIKHDKGFALIQFDFGFAISEADTNCPYLNLTSTSHYLNLTLAWQDNSPKLKEVCPKLVQHCLDKNIAM